MNVGVHGISAEDARPACLTGRFAFLTNAGEKIRVTSAHADQKGGWGHDEDAVPGVQVGEMRVAGNNQLGHGGIGQGKKNIVFGVRAVADNLRDIKHRDVITKAGDEGFPLNCRQVLVEFGVPQYCFQFL